MKYKHKDNFSDEEASNFDFNEPDDENYPKSKKRLFLAIIAGIILITFVIWSFPHIGIIFSDLSFLKQNQQLKDEEIVQNSLPSIVSIEVKGEGNINNRKGTGFNISSGGLILTNYHVVEESSSIKVIFPDGQYFFSDDYKQIANADIAIIKLTAQGLPYLSLDLQQIIKPEDLVTVIGNPLGYKQISVQGNVGSHYKFEDYQIFEIKAPIKKGSSGSPVLNSSGDVVGIVFAHGDFELDGKIEYRALAIPLKGFADEIQSAINDN